jgi:two-component system, OmpR family, response regulator VanR
VRVLIVEDEPYMAEAIRDGLRLEAIAADIAGDGDTALELLTVNDYDIAVLDRDVPGPTGDEIAKHIVASGSGMPILMLTAADRLDDKATGFELGADDYLTKPFELQELVLRLRALDRRRVHHRPPVREIAGLRLDPFRREVYRDGRYVALTRKQFAVLEVLVAAEGGVVSAEELLERAWDENADPFTNAVRITVSALRKRLGEPQLIATVPGVGYRIDTGADASELVDRLRLVNSRAIDLTEALLLLSRADQRSFIREHVDLSLTAEEATETLLPLAERHGLTIETSREEAPTIGSHALLLQMTTNLVHNAIVHNLPEQGTVWVTTSVHAKTAALTVENTGKMLTPRMVATLAEPFQRGTERIRSDHAGVGLGLAIVNSIARAHDGTLTLTPRPTGGLRVTVHLPAESTPVSHSSAGRVVSSRRGTHG